MAMSCKIGDRVEFRQVKGVVRFVGETEFAVGKTWIGIELDAPEGKNNGSVNGVEYFQCKEKHGLFVEQSSKNKLRVLRATRANSRLSYAPSQSASSLKSESQDSPVSTLSSHSSSTTASAQKTYLLREKKRALDARISATRKSNIGSSSKIVSTSKLQTPGSSSPKVSSEIPTPTPNSESKSNTTKEYENEREVLKQELDKTREQNLRLEQELQSQKEKYDRFCTAQKGSEDVAEDCQQDLDLVKKLRKENVDLENELKTAQRELANEKQKLSHVTKELDDMKLELEHVATAKEILEDQVGAMESEQRLQKMRLEHSNMEQKAKENTHIAKLEREVKTLRSALEESNDCNENLKLDIEQATVEKELAEEKVEEVEFESERLKNKIEDLQIQLDQMKSILKEKENATTTNDGSGGGKSNEDILMEQNVKLREALKRLHQLNIDDKESMTKEIRTLTKEKESLSKACQEAESLRKIKIKLEDEMIELKEMLDAANAYEEMVENLTEKNIDMSEEIEKLRKMNNELEEMREVSEELEEQQTEYQNQLLEEMEATKVANSNLRTQLNSFKNDLEEKQAALLRFSQLISEQEENASKLKKKIETDESETLKIELKLERLNENSLKTKLLQERNRSLSSRLQMMSMAVKAQLSVAKMNNLKLLLPETTLTESKEIIEFVSIVDDVRYRALTLSDMTLLIAESCFHAEYFSTSTTANIKSHGFVVTACVKLLSAIAPLLALLVEGSSHLCTESAEIYKDIYERFLPPLSKVSTHLLRIESIFEQMAKQQDSTIVEESATALDLAKEDVMGIENGAVAIQSALKVIIRRHKREGIAYEGILFEDYPVVQAMNLYTNGLKGFIQCISFIQDLNEDKLSAPIANESKAGKESEEPIDNEAAFAAIRKMIGKIRNHFMTVLSILSNCCDVSKLESLVYLADVLEQSTSTLARATGLQDVSHSLAILNEIDTKFREILQKLTQMTIKTCNNENNSLLHQSYVFKHWETQCCRVRETLEKAAKNKIEMESVKKALKRRVMEVHMKEKELQSLAIVNEQLEQKMIAAREKAASAENLSDQVRKLEAKLAEKENKHPDPQSNRNRDSGQDLSSSTTPSKKILHDSSYTEEKINESDNHKQNVRSMFNSLDSHELGLALKQSRKNAAFWKSVSMINDVKSLMPLSTEYVKVDSKSYKYEYLPAGLIKSSTLDSERLKETLDSKINQALDLQSRIRVVRLSHRTSTGNKTKSPDLFKWTAQQAYAMNFLSSAKLTVCSLTS